MKPLRLCLFTQQYGHRWSGLGTYATNLIHGLADAGHEVTVVCPEESGRGDVHHKIRLITIPKNRLDPSHGHWFTLSHKFSKLLPKLQQEGNFHLTHFTDAREALFCTATDVPLVGTVHDCYFAEAPANFLSYRLQYHDWIRRFLYYHAVRFFEPRAFKKLKRIIANSRYVKEALIRCYHLQADHIEVIYNGVQELSTSPSSRTAPHPDETRMLFVGSNFQRKGLPTLIRALPQVLVRVPHAVLYVIGKDPNQEAMQRLCQRMKVGNHVRFLGGLPHSEVLRHFTQADIFVMPSLIEGFGIVFLEAMAAGVPAIGSSLGGTRELITDGVNGFLVKPLDVQNLAQKICMVLENKPLREQIVAQGYQTAKRFTLKQMVERTTAYYEKVIREP
jgi:glycosyltransferase involved in cell wall biosynthesis